MLIAKGISVDSDVIGGRPAVAGTRVAVASILGYLSAGDTPEDIVEALPPLTIENIHDCLAYAALITDGIEAVPARISA